MNKSYLQSICLSRNVPASFLATTSIKLDNYLTSCSYKNENGKIIYTTIQEQRQNWQSLLRDPLYPQLIIIHTSYNERLCNQIGAKLFRRMVTIYYQQPQEKRRKTLPYWYPLPGGSFWDFGLSEKIGNTCGIFLTNIHTNSTAEKMDKLHDFLQMYKNVARVIMVTGGMPWEFIREKLHTIPDKLLYLGEKHD